MCRNSLWCTRWIMELEAQPVLVPSVASFKSFTMSALFPSLHQNQSYSLQQELTPSPTRGQVGR